MLISALVNDDAASFLLNIVQGCSKITRRKYPGKGNALPKVEIQHSFKTTLQWSAQLHRNPYSLSLIKYKFRQSFTWSLSFGHISQLIPHETIALPKCE